MSASPQKLKSLLSLGIIAGGGDIPAHLVQACQGQGLKTFVIAFEGQTDAKSYQGAPHLLTRLGAAGRVIKTLKAEGISDLVLIGRIRRPSLKELKPDLKTAEFFATEGLRALGDDGLLKALRRFLEKEGFQIHGVQEFLPELLAPSGVLGQVSPTSAQSADIERGTAVLHALAPYDIGQAVVMQDGHVLGIEASEGTDALIARCASLQRKGKGAVLVKMCKAQQDRDLDLPTIGIQTIEQAVQAGFSGVAVHAGQSLMVDLAGILELAERSGLFLYGAEA